MFGNGVIESAWSEPARDALARLAQRQRGTQRHRMPVGVIGPRDATDEQMQVAERIAYVVASTGVMAAPCARQP
ncbi:hypothetical protein WL51_05995 [Burkholderia ubonensis]|nr:hypothetical protein WL51_05995 [Burkholderia ubonensis]